MCFFKKKTKDMSKMRITDSKEKLSPSEPGTPLSEEKVGALLTSIAEFEKKLAEPREPRETSTDIRHSIEVTWDDFEKKAPTFQEMLLEKLKEKDISNVDFYKAAWIDRKLFSAIINNVYYKPKKETAVACCLGLKLTYYETNKLMEAAGYVLSDSIRWDIVIKFCILNNIYAIDQVNQVLYAAGEKCFGEK